MSNQAALAFLLEGPLQAWGVTSRFQTRQTELYPSKSGVLGLVAAAMGIDKTAPDEPERIQELARLIFATYRLDYTNDKRVRELLTDYHTVGGGYDKSTPMGKLSMSRKASGAAPTTVVTRRSYLCDSRFIATFEGDAALLQRVEDALLNPVWGVWFGRKCCLPATPLTPTAGADATTAIEQLLQHRGIADRLKEDVQINSLPARRESDDDGAFYLPDQPESFAERRYRPRANFQPRGKESFAPPKKPTAPGANWQPPSP